MKTKIKLILGDCLIELKELQDSSVDAIITDPPAGISFMNRDWDHNKGGRYEWIKWMSSISKECIRILKPGGHALVWSFPRTSHWTATAWENSGFEVRDCIYHAFGNRLPKGHNIGKAVDKLQGNKREVVGSNLRIYFKKTKKGDKSFYDSAWNNKDYINVPVTKGNSEWEGWGTALKPAVECWWLLRKPISERNVVLNVLKWGVGALAIDNCRTESTKGRWPANLAHDGSDEVMAMFPVGNSGSAARLFYCSKPSKSERDMGCAEHNSHPTVKPLSLCRYLITLITKEGQTVLDPFLGSGSVAVAAKQIGRNFIGIELNPEYMKIAKCRIDSTNERGLLVDSLKAEDTQSPVEVLR